MEQCVRHSHKVARASQDSADRWHERVKELERLNKDITELNKDADALYTRQVIHIEWQAAEIGRLTKQLAAHHGRKEAYRAVNRTATQRKGSCNRRIVGRRKYGSSIA
jgi:hypothetical protein